MGWQAQINGCTSKDKAPSSRVWPDSGEVKRNKHLTFVLPIEAV